MSEFRTFGILKTFIKKMVDAVTGVVIMICSKGTRIKLSSRSAFAVKTS